MGVLKRLRASITPALLLVSLASQNAEALPTYFEFGAGLAKVSDSSPLTGVTGSLSGASIPVTFGIQLQNSATGLLFSIASQARYVTGSNPGGTRASFMTVAPTFRIEFWKLVLGVGYSKWIYRDLAFNKYPTTTALIFEAQLLFPITPEIDFGVSAARQSVTSMGASGPDPSMEYTGFFRLNFGYSSADLDKRRKFKGWRYPYGKGIW